LDPFINISSEEIVRKAAQVKNPRSLHRAKTFG